MIILGLNAFHADSAAAIVSDGRLVAAAEEERFRRVKHWAGFPLQAIRYCLNEAGVGLADIDRVAINQDDRAQLGPKLLYLVKRPASLGLAIERLKARRARAGVAALLKRHFPGLPRYPNVDRVEHHLAHLSSAFLVSPFNEAALVSVDGFGDFSSAAWGLGQGVRIAVEGRVLFPHSLGVFYQAITQYLGFPSYGDEYKVMGLAPYGAPRCLAQMRELLRLKPDGGYELGLEYFRHCFREAGDPLTFGEREGAPEFSDLFAPALEGLLGPRRAATAPIEERHRDIARSAQAMYEEAFFNLLNVLYARHKTPNLALAGGCAANSVANGKIRRMTGFRKVYVHPAAGDAGGAVGAAFVAWTRRARQRRFVMSHANWGPQYSREAIDALLKARGAAIANCGCVIASFADQDRLCRGVAALVAEGTVVGWFQGRMEWGPRALGNRSIVCDPRRADMKTVLNLKIKRRESFRPFAPSVLAEHVGEWFEEDDDAPFMEQVLKIRPEKRAAIPAVTHVDGSARLQTVARDANPRFHALISAFHALSGVPLVLNTSFNENEPIVCAPDEALDCFLRTNMDALVLGDVTLARGRWAEILASEANLASVV